MKVRLNQDCELMIVEGLDENEEPIESPEVFKSGDILEFDFFDHPEKFNGEGLEPDTSLVNVQFPNGSMGYGISIDWYDVIEYDDDDHPRPKETS